MCEQPYPRSLRKLYRGYPVNCLNMTAATGTQFLFDGMLKRLLGEEGQGESALPAWVHLSGAFAAGAASGVVVAPIELVMIQQQLYGSSVSPSASAAIARGSGGTAGHRQTSGVVGGVRAHLWDGVLVEERAQGLDMGGVHGPAQHQVSVLPEGGALGGVHLALGPLRPPMASAEQRWLDGRIIASLPLSSRDDSRCGWKVPQARGESHPCGRRRVWCREV